MSTEELQFFVEAISFLTEKKLPHSFTGWLYVSLLFFEDNASGLIACKVILIGYPPISVKRSDTSLIRGCFTF